jgi:hypothetical protein
MKRASVLFASALATLLFGGAAMAKDPAATSQSPAPSPDTTSPSKSSPRATAPAEKPGVLAMPHHVTGSVMSIDKKANSVAIRDTKGEELVLVADAETAADLSRLKVGDQVKVTYKKSHGQMVATKITTTITMTAPPDTSRTTK